MKLINRSLVALSLAFVVSSAVGVYAQTAQTPTAVDVTRTRQRVVTKTPDAPDAAKVVDRSGDALAKTANLTQKNLAAKPANAKRERTTAAERSDAISKSAQPPTTGTNGDAQPNSGVDSGSQVAAEVSDPAQENRHEQASEEAAIVPYYNNFFNTYRLGPEDIISVNVFGQDRYSRSAITIPPSGRISLALIPGGIFVNGKTVEEVAQAITKRYDEYIRDPQVSVSLDKASSYRYSVIGDVAQPGIRLMSRRLTVTEALSEAGGVLSTGNRSKVVVLRRQANGNLEPITVNVSAIYKGKAPDITYLVPGDQILVPGNKLKSFQKIMTFFPVLNFARIFTGGIF